MQGRTVPERPILRMSTVSTVNERTYKKNCGVMDEKHDGIWLAVKRLVGDKEINVLDKKISELKEKNS